MARVVHLGEDLPDQHQSFALFNQESNLPSIKVALNSQPIEASVVSRKPQEVGKQQRPLSEEVDSENEDNNTPCSSVCLSQFNSPTAAQTSTPAAAQVKLLGGKPRQVSGESLIPATLLSESPKTSCGDPQLVPFREFRQCLEVGMKELKRKLLQEFDRQMDASLGTNVGRGLSRSMETAPSMQMMQSGSRPMHNIDSTHSRLSGVLDTSERRRLSYVQEEIIARDSLGSNATPIEERWYELCIQLLTPKASRLTVHRFRPRECWAGYLTLLRSDAGAIREFELAKNRISTAKTEEASKHGLESLLKSHSMLGPISAVSEGRCVVNPHSWLCITWRLFSLFLLLYDALLLPISAFFEMSNSPVLNMIMVIALIFWALDIMVSFRTGKDMEGTIEVEMRPHKIARMYAKTWLPFDLSLVIFDWALFSCDAIFGDQPMGSFSGAARIIRILRLVRLLRLAKLQLLLKDVLNINIKRVIVVSSMIKLTLFYAIYFHFLACVWYYIGQSDGGWADRCQTHSASVANCYFEAAHWAFAQLCGAAYSSYNTTLEWAFATVSLYVGMIMFAYFLGLMSDVLAQKGGLDKNEMRIRCAKYTQRYRLSSALSHRLLRYITASHMEPDIGTILRHDCEMLASLPSSLAMEILMETRKPLLARVRIIGDLEYISTKILTQLCSDASDSVISVHGDTIFSHGDAAEYWRILEYGTLIYACGEDSGGYRSGGGAPGSRLLDSTFSKTDSVVAVQSWTAKSKHLRSSFSQLGILSESTDGNLGNLSSMKDVNAWETLMSMAAEGRRIHSLMAGTSISEMVLWTSWVHQGDLVATSDSILLQLSLNAFSNVLKVRSDCCLLAARHAHLYVKELNSVLNSVDGGVSDLFIYSPSLEDDADFDRSTTSERYKVFLSHYKAEAGTEAALMSEALQTLLCREGLCSEEEANVFLDSEDLTDLNELKSCVTKSENLVLLLTPGVLLRPWCLVEIVTAMNNEVQIVPVEIQRPGMKFVYPDDGFYSKLRSGSLFKKQEMTSLTNEGMTLEVLENAIRHVFRQIALPFSPHKSKNIREAELLDIVKRCCYSKSAPNSHVMSSANLHWRSEEAS